MPNRAEYIRKRIRELQRQLEEERADNRKQYFRDYYKMNRATKLAAANARHQLNREQGAV